MYHYISFVVNVWVKKTVVKYLSFENIKIGVIFVVSASEDIFSFPLWYSLQLKHLCSVKKNELNWNKHLLKILDSSPCCSFHQEPVNNTSNNVPPIDANPFGADDEEEEEGDDDDGPVPEICKIHVQAIYAHESTEEDELQLSVGESDLHMVILNWVTTECRWVRFEHGHIELSYNWV